MFKLSADLEFKEYYVHSLLAFVMRNSNVDALYILVSIDRKKYIFNSPEYDN